MKNVSTNMFDRKVRIGLLSAVVAMPGAYCTLFIALSASRPPVPILIDGDNRPFAQYDGVEILFPKRVMPDVKMHTCPHPDGTHVT